MVSLIHRKLDGTQKKYSHIIGELHELRGLASLSEATAEVFRRLGCNALLIIEPKVFERPMILTSTRPSFDRVSSVLG